MKKDMWYHRRVMTYASLIAGIAFPIIAVIEPSLKEIAMPFYIFVGITVTAYMKYATDHDRNFKETLND